MPSETNQFSSTLPIIVLTRPVEDKDWQELDRGPGYFTIPEGHEVRVRIKSIGDDDLTILVHELQSLEPLRFLDLSENRNISNDGLRRLHSLPQITGLSLSSTTISNFGLTHLSSLRRLAYLDLSFCNKLSDPALKTLDAMRSLLYVNLQGCLGFSNGGLARIRRRTLEIYR